MKPMFLACLLALVAALQPLPAQADGPSSSAGGGGIYLSSDSDDFSSRRWSADLMGSHRHLDQRTGLRYTDYAFSRNQWRGSAQQLKFVTQQIDPVSRDGWSLEGGLFRQPAHDLFTLDASYRTTLSPSAAIEIFGTRDFIETVTALERNLHFDFIGSAVDYLPHPAVTMVGMLGHQGFSDGNQRRHARGKLIYQPAPDLGLTLQLRYRYFDSSEAFVDRAYFNPTRYDEGMLAAGFRQRVAGWRTALTAGLGRQRVNDDPQTGTWLFEAGAERQQAGMGIRLRAAVMRSSSFGGPDYTYRYISGDLLIPF